MPTALISHPDCRLHDTGETHPECAQRLAAIEDQLLATGVLGFLDKLQAPEASLEQLLRVHDAQYLEWLDTILPENGLYYIDPDTPIGPHSMKAARRAAGAAVLATDLVMTGEAENAFCNVRPPGHHASSSRAMGFCLLNNVAVGVAHALEQHGLERVAVFDIDGHHGNGTDTIFATDKRVLVCSVFEQGLYPFGQHQARSGEAVEAPLPTGAGGEAMRREVRARLLPAMEDLKPQLVFVSAGFDAHADDCMTGLRFSDGDFDWLTRQALAVADEHAEGRLVSVLEGGYDLPALRRCATAHLRRLARI